MATKQKLYLSIFSIIALVLVMVATTWGVLAASIQQISGVFSVIYNADNVNCTVYACYIQQKSTTPVYFTMDQKSQPYLHFNLTDTGEGTLYYDPVVMDKDNYWVLFCYYFRNDNPSEGRDLNIILDDNSLKTNVTCHYYIVYDELTFDTAQGYHDEVATSGTTTSSAIITVNPQKMAYIYVLVEATSLANGASYENIQGNCVSWTLKSAE